MACPFKGLAGFDVSDARYFFGRERLVAELVARLVGAPLLGVVGPSGSGKSSVVRAGLVPALAGGVLPGSQAWPRLVIRPGEHPMRALHDAEADVGAERRVVLVVDQFEELFGVCRDARERVAFIDALVRPARRRRGDLVVVAIRADFYGRCAAYPALADLLAANHVLVGPMRRDELRRAIESPARAVGLHVEPEVVDALIADVAEQPGALPLLSAALVELWEHRDGRRLRLSAYVPTGGVQGAVARLAEAAYQRLDDGQRRIARAILLRLAGEGEGEAVVRARVALDEFGQDAPPVLAELAAARLLTIGAGEVEVAHEALLREWPRLRGWLEEDTEGRRLHRRLRAAANDWEAGGRDTGELYRGARLAAALDWAAEHDPELNATERAFLAHSRIANERAHRRLRLVLAGVASLLVVAVIAGVVALIERRAALEESVAAAAQRLAAQALLEVELDRSLLLARQAVAMEDSVQTRGNLLATLLKSPAAIGVLRGDGDPLVSLDLSPDGGTLALLDEGGTVRFVDTRTRRAIGPPYASLGQGAAPGAGDFGDVRFSPDGSRVAVGGMAPAILDARSHRLLTTLRIRPDRLVLSVRFSPDGRTVFAVVAPYGGLNPDMSIQRFDAADGWPLDPEHVIARRFSVVDLMVTSDGRWLVATSSGDGTVIRDAVTLRPLRRVSVRAERVALSADDRTMLLAGRDRSVRFLDLDTGALRLARGRHAAAIAHAAFMTDGRQAVTAGVDGRTTIWDVERATATDTLEGHAGGIPALATTQDDSTLYTAGADGNVLIWDLAGTRRLDRPFDIPAGRRSHLVPVFALSPDGRSLAIAYPDGAVSVSDPRTLRTRSRAFRVKSKEPVTSMRFLPDGRLLAIAGIDRLLALVDPDTGEEVMRLRGHRSAGTRAPIMVGTATPRGIHRRPRAHQLHRPGVAALSFSANGRLLATGTPDVGTAADGIARLWALPSGRPVGRPFVFPDGVNEVSLSPDGRTLAVIGYSRGDVIDVVTGRRLRSLLGRETVYEFAHFTPDGRLIVTGTRQGWVRLWSTDSGKPVTGTFGRHPGDVTASLSPDGRTVATGSTDGRIRLWDLSSERPIATPLPGVPNRPVVPQFTPDGAYLLAITSAGRAYRWDMRPSRWAQHACEVAGRPLTRSEWQKALPEYEYAPACTR